jgi:hypothetical protein
MGRVRSGLSWTRRLVQMNPEDADRLVPLLEAAIPADALRIELGSFDYRAISS